jgi:hypothetical protein
MDSEAFKVRPFSDLSKTIQYSFVQNAKNITSVVLISEVRSVAMFAVLATRTWRAAGWIVLQCYV